MNIESKSPRKAVYEMGVRDFKEDESSYRQTKGLPTLDFYNASKSDIRSDFYDRRFQVEDASGDGISEKAVLTFPPVRVVESTPSEKASTKLRHKLAEDTDLPKLTEDFEGKWDLYDEEIVYDLRDLKIRTSLSCSSLDYIERNHSLKNANSVLKATEDLLDGYLKKVHEMPIEDLEVAEQDCAIVAKNSTKLLKQVLSIWDFIERRENIVLNGRFSLFPCCQRTNETINKIYLEKAKLVSRVALIALKRIEVLWQVTRWKFKKENLVDIQYVLTSSQISNLFQRERDPLEGLKFRSEKKHNDGKLLLKEAKKEFKKLRNATLASFLARATPEEVRASHNKVYLG